MGIGSSDAVAGGNTNSIDLETGSTQWLSIADASQTGLDITSDITLEAWVKIESAPASGVAYGIITKWKGAGEQRSYSMQYYNNAGTPQIFISFSSNGTTVSQIGTNQTLNTATWYHVAVSYVASTGEAKVYLDGTLLATQTGHVTSIYNGAADFNIGAENGGNNMDGLIDDARIWSVARTGTQINDNKSTEIDSATNLQGSWHLNDVLTDSSGNSNTLTNNGTAVFSTDVPF